MRTEAVGRQEQSTLTHLIRITHAGRVTIALLQCWALRPRCNSTMYLIIVTRPRPRCNSAMQLIIVTWPASVGKVLISAWAMSTSTLLPLPISLYTPAYICMLHRKCISVKQTAHVHVYLHAPIYLYLPLPPSSPCTSSCGYSLQLPLVVEGGDSWQCVAHLHHGHHPLLGLGDSITVI